MRPEPKLLMLLRLLKPLVPVPTPVPITEMSVEQEERLTPTPSASVVTVRQCGVWGIVGWDFVVFVNCLMVQPSG